MNEPRKDLNRPGAHRCGASPPPLASFYITARWDTRVLGEGAEYLLKHALVDHRINLLQQVARTRLENDRCYGRHRSLDRSSLASTPAFEQLQAVIAKDIPDNLNTALPQLIHASGRNGNLSDANPLSILDPTGVHNSAQPRPHTSGETHRTGFTGGIDCTPAQLQRFQAPTGIPNRLYFGMGGGVHVGLRTIMRHRDNLSFSRDAGPEGHFTLFDSLPGHLNREPHEICVSHRLGLEPPQTSRSHTGNCGGLLFLQRAICSYPLSSVGMESIALWTEKMSGTLSDVK